MARTLDQHLAALRNVDGTTASIPTIVDALRFDKSGCGVAIASAAKLIADHHLSAVVPDLVDAFDRLIGDAKRDPGCRGKNAIARALHALDCWEERVFVRGLRIEQPEGMRSEITGRPDDTAAELRGLCGLAHAHFARTEALDVLAKLLTDVEVVTRIAAARALGDAGRPDASALLRYFLLASGEADGEVLASALESLLSLDRESSTPFAIGLLEEHDERAEAAALALGSARAADAMDALVGWANGCRPEQRHRVGYLAIALLRSDAATEYLLEAIEERAKADALAAVKALGTFADDPSIREQLRVRASKVTDKTVAAAIAEFL